MLQIVATWLFVRLRLMINSMAQYFRLQKVEGIALLIFTARKRSLRRLRFFTCLSVMLGCTPPDQRQTPSPRDHRQAPHGTRRRHPLPGTRGRHHPRSSACWEIRATSGRFASYWNAYFIGGSRGGVRDARPPWASKFFRFHAVFGKIWRVHAPPGGFTPPPRENPGSATVLVIILLILEFHEINLLMKFTIPI